MLDNLNVFATVVEQASINRASQVLNMTQPALSRKIKKLEDQLGVELFQRKGKKLVLTRIGEIGYDIAVEMRELQLKLQQAIAEYKAKGTSRITIGASLTTLQSTLPDLIAIITGSGQEIDIKAITGKTHEIVTLVKEKKADIGLVASSIQDPELTCVPLFDDHLCLVLPHDHTLAGKATIDIGDLSGLPMILFSKGTWYRILMDQWFHRYMVFPYIKMEIDSFEAIIRLVATCGAATLLPKSYLRKSLLDDNGLTMRDVPELVQTKRTTALIFKNEGVDETVRRLVDRAKAFFHTRR